MLLIITASWYMLASVVTFAAYAWDKRKAALGHWRTRERTLHVLALVGGFPGALVARRVLRHKNRKLGFTIVLCVIAALHACAWLAWWKWLR